MAGREALFHEVQYQHGGPFQSLGGMHRGKDDAGSFAGCRLFLRLVKGYLRDEGLHVAIGRGHGGKGFQSLRPARPVIGEQCFHDRLISFLYPRKSLTGSLM